MKPSRCTIAALAALGVAFYTGCRGRVASAPKTRPPVVEVAPVIQRDVPIYGE